MKARRRVLDAHDSTPTIRTNLPCPEGMERAQLGLGRFWGGEGEKAFWNLPGCT